MLPQRCTAMLPRFRSRYEVVCATLDLPSVFDYAIAIAPSPCDFPNYPFATTYTAKTLTQLNALQKKLRKHQNYHKHIILFPFCMHKVYGIRLEYYTYLLKTWFPFYRIWVDLTLLPQWLPLYFEAWRVDSYLLLEEGQWYTFYPTERLRKEEVVGLLRGRAAHRLLRHLKPQHFSTTPFHDGILLNDLPEESLQILLQHGTIICDQHQPCLFYFNETP